MVTIIERDKLISEIKKYVGSMRFTMVTTYMVVIFAALTLVTIYTANMLSSNFYSTERAGMFAKANIIAQTVGEVWSADPNETQRTFADPVQSSLAGTRMRGIVVDKTYKVLYDTSSISEMIGKVFIRDVLQKSLDGEQSAMLNDIETESRMLSVAVPVIANGETVGGVYIAYSVDRIDNAIRSARNSLVVFSVIIAFIIGALSFGLSHLISAPMRELREAAEEISHGNFKARVAPKGQNELRQMGEAMNYMANELELMEDKRRKFVSDVSHELKTPMTGIKLICDTCEDIEDPVMQKEFIGDISSEVDRLSRLVEKLLTLSRLDEGKMNIVSVDIRSMIDKIVRTLSPVANSKNISVTVEYKYDSYMPTMMDYDKMFEAFYNIADNAIKYSNDGGFLHITVDTDMEMLIISFYDNGPGIPENEREHIFERFYRLDDSRARDTGGTGLGLAITKEAIAAHGGTIAVKTPDNGEGSIFVVKLPIRSGEEEEA